MIPLRDSLRARHKPYVNWLLIIINFIVFFGYLGLSQNGLEELYFRYGVVPIRVVHLLQTGASWHLVIIPFITAMFLHGGWLHIIGNMWYLFIFGDNVEDLLGHSRYLLFYLITGVIGSLAHVLANAGSPVPIVGASGAIAGVLGGYFLLFPSARILSLAPFFIFFLVEIPAVFFLAFWFILQLVNGAVSLGGVANPVAWIAHVGGFLAGAVLIKLFAPRHSNSLPR
ncbi:MAG TPA: rhomboid family intramembrane serine protease [Desulfotomaculum sp.]|nr:MAG: Rhomboid family protein [Desulfotomaculum sp. 46_80]KUK85239.1 MAG: Rhomboid family protein [Desulfofundulus kuznetsovii]HAG11147.1 rhomboid family intramembrane serine protease [Desulfotomaculum sp.]HBY03257.1 rhomboid family intramembrane serine protease [Desulfotomaculum sp.]